MIYKVAIPPRCAVTANHPSLHKVGLHQCPSEKKGQGAPGHRQPVPSRVPFARQTAPKPRASSCAASRFTTEKDSLAEGNAFEISVPRQIGRGFQGFRQIREIAPPSPKIRRMIERAIGSQTPPTRRSAVRIWEEQRARGGAGARLCCRSARDTAAACVVRLLPAPLVPWMWIAGDLDAACRPKCARNRTTSASRAHSAHDGDDRAQWRRDADNAIARKTFSMPA